MIVMIFLMTGLYGVLPLLAYTCSDLVFWQGPSFWDTGILTFARLDHVEWLRRVPNIGLNESFMVFGGFGLAFNILNSYMNVRKATRRSGKSSLRPLLFLLPFVTAAGIQIVWLSHPEFNHSAIIKSATFVPFLCAWGLQFAHQVGRMILAHVTSTPFPRWDWMWIWSIIGAVDANLPHILGW